MQMLSHFQESGASLHLTDTREDKCHNLELPPFLLLSTSFVAEHNTMLWNTPLVIGKAA